jgi:hypothetical protein
VYRAPKERSDVTLWYGPFEGRWPRAVLPMAIGAFLLLVAFLEERRSFHALACARPGVCTVSRGSVLLGVRESETFDPATVVSVTERRTAERRPRTQAVLVDTLGNERVLAEGPFVPELVARTEPFFTTRGPAAVSVRASLGFEGWMAAGVAAMAALVVGLLLVRECLRAAARVRVDVIWSRGVVRVERMGLGGVPPVEVPMADIVAIEIARVRDRIDAAARVVLVCREGPDVPLVEHFLHGPSRHDDFAVELRDQLGLPTR